ncbi:hypothetical protein ACFQ48_12405 [Hymenobacter caeli]|uniref:Membrane protein YgcG n=1 Tax=Hymenobacter caeli TaxID=2735894 RepID=A0ABX2FPY9_9BACT|nr:hypothetical protein [Hymenobacter caeli]NRT18485.1 putative membrane protein YgcG [Hymenobacter caeli]
MRLQAYNPAWALHAAVRAAATRWQRQGLLVDGQHAAIDAAYPLDCYQPAWLLRAVLFFFTVLGCAAAAAFCALPLLNSSYSDAGLTAWLLLLAAGFLLVLELIITSSRPYHAGYDNAILYAAVLALLGLGVQAQLAVGGAGTLAGPRLAPFLLYGIAVLGAATVRYADLLAAALVFAAALALAANLALQTAAGPALLPFVAMLFAAGAAAVVHRLARGPHYFYYRTCRQTVKALALATFYLGGNYLVVREGNAALSHLPFAPQIPFAPLFYALTALIPLAYLYYGLRRHDRLVLIMGLLAVAFSVFTLRYYRALLPPAVAAALAGALLLAVAAAALRYLGTPRHGLTAAADDEAVPLFNLESLVVAQYNVPGQVPAAGFQFGGGDSGGGGATGQF